jgi:hypothetical protein
MPFIEKRDDNPLDVDARMNVPAMEIPSFRVLVANERQVSHKIMIQVRGGIGDYICAEPAIRYACENFKSEIYVATRAPEFYRHLKINKIFDTTQEMPSWMDYLNFQTIHVGDELNCQFLTHMFNHVVDYHSMAMFRVQLPNSKKCIVLDNSYPEMEKAKSLINTDTDIALHPGRTWKSRTFPKPWWDTVIEEIKYQGRRPVLIGAECFNECGTVKVNNEGCLDLRGKLTLMESVAVTKMVRVVLTNDSAPLHMAASGEAWIGFISTVKMPDLLLHYRNGGKMGWRMKNHSKDWLCQNIDMTPTNPEQIRFDEADTTAFLPDPKEYASWAVARLIYG